MTLRELKIMFWELVGGEVTSSQITEDTLEVWANMGVRDLVEASKCLQANAALEVEQGKQEYDLPDDCVQVWRAAYDDQKLRFTGKWELMQADSSWDTMEGLPRAYYLDGVLGKIGLYRMPSSDSLFDGSDLVGRWLDLFYNASPPALSSDDDEPALPLWAHPYVLFYMLSSAYSMVGAQRMAEKAGYWLSMYRYGRDRLSSRSTDSGPDELTMFKDVGEIDGLAFGVNYPLHIPEPGA
jgi:hypothetical protein